MDNFSLEMQRGTLKLVEDQRERWRILYFETLEKLEDMKKDKRDLLIQYIKWIRDNPKVKVYVVTEDPTDGYEFVKASDRAVEWAVDEWLTRKN